MRELTRIAAEMLECAEAWEPWARLLGNVRADEIAALARAGAAIDAENARLQAAAASLLDYTEHVGCTSCRNKGCGDLAWDCSECCDYYGGGKCTCGLDAARKALEEDHA